MEGEGHFKWLWVASSSESHWFSTPHLSWGTFSSSCSPSAPQGAFHTGWLPYRGRGNLMKSFFARSLFFLTPVQFRSSSTTLWQVCTLHVRVICMFTFLFHVHTCMYIYVLVHVINATWAGLDWNVEYLVHWTWWGLQIFWFGQGHGIQDHACMGLCYSSDIPEAYPRPENQSSTSFTG